MKPFEESSELVTNGAFRISHSPMYLGHLLILLGLGVLMRSFGPFILMLIFGVLMDRVFVQGEDQMLDSRFGVVWAAYQALVR